MSNQRRIAPTPGQLICSLLLGSIAVLIVGVQPILLGALVDAHRLMLDDVGVMAMGEIITLGIGATIGGVLPLRHFRFIAILSAMLCAVADVATPLATSAMGLIGARALAGLAEGILLWTSTCIIVRTTAPSRIAGVFMVVQTLAQAGVAMLLANFALPRAGWAGGFYSLAILSTFAAFLALSQPAGLEPLRRTGNDAARRSWTLGNAFPLAVVFLEQATIGALWAYFDPLGQAIGLNAQASQTMVSLVLVAQLFGGGLGALAVNRISPLPGLTLSCMLLTGVALGIQALGYGESTRFMLLAMLLGFVWVFSFPFQIELCFKADPTGNVATMVPAAQLLGSAFGPLIASFVIVGDDARPATQISLIFGVLAITLLLTGWRLTTRAWRRSA
ncbi:MFS transporter [Robbsia andropogonis]|uniref:MFS transporter n=1 Tax=Robbsia andropogonis TaxID=28092 RepID=UPI002A6B47EF|nr:MFS transporter [Robbsia andropogonis]